MSGALRVKEPGLATTVQDLGRPGHQDVGVPVSGALDPESLVLANALVGNAPDLAGLEARYTGPDLLVEAERALVALTGTANPLDVIDENGDIKRIPSYRSVWVTRGQRVRLRQIDDTVTACLAVAGGIAVPQVLGSRSTYGPAGLGGLDGRPLAAGDALPLADDDGLKARPALEMDRPPLAPPERFRVLPGPQDDRFSDDAMALFLETEWRVTSQADRMGIRLDGPALDHVGGHDIVSDGIVTGAIQVPGQGRPIVLLNDRQTTGGYPKIACVISADLPALARLSAGDAIRFQAVDLDGARQARATSRRRLAAMIDGLRPVREAALDLEALYTENLISGVFGEP